MYESVIDEVVFISRASEGAVSTEWVMNQPVFVRSKYVDVFTKELKEREKALRKNNPGN